MSDPRAARLAALVDGLSAAHLDGLLLTGLSNIRYLTGFSGSSALLVVTPRDVMLITDFRYQTQVADEVGAIARVSIEASSLWSGLWQQLASLPAMKVVGFETAHVQHRLVAEVEQVPGGSGVPRSISSRRCGSARIPWKSRTSARPRGWQRARSLARYPAFERGSPSCRWLVCWKKRFGTREVRDFPFRRSSPAVSAPRCLTRAPRPASSRQGTFC